MHETENDPFAENLSDKWAKRFQVGLPMIGSLLGPLGSLITPPLAEYLAATLPNQRMDRLCAYLSDLRSKLTDEILDSVAKSTERMALFEEGLYAAGFTPHKDRLERISNFVANGISKSEFDADHESFLLGIVKNVSDVDFIILNYYKTCDRYNKEEILSYEKKYPEIFPDWSIKPPTDDKHYNYRKKSILDGRNRNLESLGLLFVMPVDVYRMHPESLGLPSEAVQNYEIEKLRDQLKALTNPRYGLSFLGEELLIRMSPTEQTA